MNLINADDLIPTINRCFAEYSPRWGKQSGPDMEATMKAFKYYLEREAGLKLDYEFTVRNMQYSYKINHCEVVDEHQLLLFRLKWS